MTTAQPAPRLWNRYDYERASALGIFRAEERLELVSGRIIEKVSPQSSAHTSAVMLCAAALREAFGSQFHIREEKPLALSEDSEPEPDVVVVRGTIRDVPEHPTPANTVLVVEVSASTLLFDQGEKARAYSQAGIQEYWIINLQDWTLVVRRDPALINPVETEYGSVMHYALTDVVTPLVHQTAPIRVSDLFPDRTAHC